MPAAHRSLSLHSPILYGVHPNAEINFRTVQGETLFRTINELASSASVGGASGASEKVRSTLDELMGSLPEPHNLIEIAERLEDDRSPAQHVFYQACACSMGMCLWGWVASDDVGLA